MTTMMTTTKITPDGVQQLIDQMVHHGLVVMMEEGEDHDDDMGFRCVWEPLAERPAEPAAE